jgi:L-methionine (R)-S-oxide reductase
VNYESLLKELEALWVGHWLTDFSNTSSYLFHEFKDINWVGFYLTESFVRSRPSIPSEKLILGPFHGKPACTEIPYGKGVCGTAFAQQKTIVVADVHAFPGHITCDPASRSEIVVPLVLSGHAIGVLDVDSASLARFQEDEKVFFTSLAQKISTRISNPAN